MAHRISHLNPKGNVFGLCSVYVFNCTLYDKILLLPFISYIKLLKWTVKTHSDNRGQIFRKLSKCLKETVQKLSGYLAP